MRAESGTWPDGPSHPIARGSNASLSYTTNGITVIWDRWKWGERSAGAERRTAAEKSGRDWRRGRSRRGRESPRGRWIGDRGPRWPSTSRCARENGREVSRPRAGRQVLQGRGHRHCHDSLLLPTRPICVPLWQADEGSRRKPSPDAGKANSRSEIGLSRIAKCDDPRVGRADARSAVVATSHRTATFVTRGVWPRPGLPVMVFTGWHEMSRASTCQSVRIGFEVPPCLRQASGISVGARGY
jgi:hypothetical protein